ncbi:MAG TPA: hypothetical protein DCG19_06770 [Cryomorphaceae bacterium]|nr:hypothetical protein [Cryomorphaceae bacterium]
MLHEDQFFGKANLGIDLEVGRHRYLIKRIVVLYPKQELMKEDIHFPEVTDVKVAVGKRIDEKGESEDYVYLINNKPTDLNNLMVVSNASEKEDGTGRKTSTLRHFIEHLDKHSSARVERIDPQVFGFYNTFWVSFYIGRELFDRKFILAPFSEWELEEIDELEMKGKIAD